MHRLICFFLATAIVQAQRPESNPSFGHDAEFHPHAFSARQVPTAEPCAQVAAVWAQMRSYPSIAIPAEMALACLRSVPVDVAGDIQEIAELKEYLQYQSTLAYLKAGVKGQREPLDLIAQLDQIAEGVKNGSYQGDYDVQLSIRTLLDSAGDFHLYYATDLTSVFGFRRAIGSIVSISSDGLAPPQIFVASDISRRNASDFTPSPLVSINGQNATKYVEDLSKGTNYHDADTRYNGALLNPALDALTPGSSPGVFASYYAMDAANATFLFANGTTRNLQNIATFTSSYDFSKIKNGASFFAAFCRGPRNVPRVQTSNVASPAPAPTPSLVGYPKPNFIIESKVFSGYSLDGKYNDTSVLVSPSFEPKVLSALNPTVSGFLEAQASLRRFFANCLKQGKEKLIIDLRGNGGGTIDMGFELFKQLFPGIEPFGGARYRSHEAFYLYSASLADVAVNGTNIDGRRNDLNPQDGDNGLQDALLWSNVLNVDGKPYKSFSEYYGPQTLQDDKFISLRRYNFSKTPGGHTLNANLTGYVSGPAPVQPFKPENIIILSDGFCGSTCAIFAELMREQAGVQTIAIGGRATNAPMQSVGGSKGSQVLPFDTIFYWANTTLNIVNALDGKQIYDYVLGTTAVGRIYNASQVYRRTAPSSDENTLLIGGVNSLNNQRQNDTTETPLEFVYEAADCRLFYTRQSYIDPTVLWKQAFEAKWGNGSCVPGSTGAPSAIGVIKGTPFELKGRSNTTNDPPKISTTSVAASANTGISRVLFTSYFILLLALLV